MAVPTYVGYNVSFQTSGNLLTLYPHASTTDGDIILNFLFTKYTFPSSPGNIVAYSSGGTKISQHNYTAAVTLATFWYRVSGSPPAYMQYLHANSGCEYGGVTATFRGCVASGTPYDFYNNEAGGGGTTWYVTSGTTTGADRLIVNGLVLAMSGKIVYNGTHFTGLAQGDISTGGNGFYGALLKYADTAAGFSPADSGSISSTVTRIGTTVALASPAAGYANKVNGVAAANIGKVDSVATANIAKVNGI